MYFLGEKFRKSAVKMDLKKFKDNSSYLFCHHLSFILQARIIGFVLNILIRANFKGIVFKVLFYNRLALLNPQKKSETLG